MMPTDRNKSPGTASAAAIADQERAYGGLSDAELYLQARNAFDEAASVLHDGLGRGERAAINRAHQLAREGNARLETIARRWMKGGAGPEN